MIAQGEKVLKTSREKRQDTESEQPARITTSTIPHRFMAAPIIYRMVAFDLKVFSIEVGTNLL